jgi:hypothetical protein
MKTALFLILLLVSYSVQEEWSQCKNGHSIMSHTIGTYSTKEKCGRDCGSSCDKECQSTSIFSYGCTTIPPRYQKASCVCLCIKPCFDDLY